MDGASLSSGISAKAPPGGGRQRARKNGGWGAAAAAPADAADAFLVLRDVSQQAKLRERAAEDRARQ